MILKIVSPKQMVKKWLALAKMAENSYHNIDLGLAKNVFRFFQIHTSCLCRQLFHDVGRVRRNLVMTVEQLLGPQRPVLIMPLGVNSDPRGELVPQG
jgi:hypothetical protein